MGTFVCLIAVGIDEVHNPLVKRIIDIADIIMTQSTSADDH